MNPAIWSKLPTEIIRKIVEDSKPSIDVQLYFKIKPKRLDQALCARIWYLLNSHDGLIYNLGSKSLHIFRIPGFHIIRRPCQLNSYDQYMAIFNEDCNQHTIEITSANGSYISCPYHDEPFYTELRVLLRGSIF
jgi:hypothetical protein